MEYGLAFGPFSAGLLAVWKAAGCGFCVPFSMASKEEADVDLEEGNVTGGSERINSKNAFSTSLTQ